MDPTTTALLDTLRASATDLAKLVEFCEQRRPPMVYVAEATVTTWEERAPTAWAATRQWLDGRGIAVRFL